MQQSTRLPVASALAALGLSAAVSAPAAALHAQAPAEVDEIPVVAADPATDSAADSAALANALRGIDAERIGADLQFFASDELGGRNTPSHEQRIAARFIENRLRRLGFEPGNGDDFLAEYELGYRALDAEATHAELIVPNGRARLSYGVDYAHPTSTESVEFEGRGAVLFAGRGTKDEVDSVEAEGRWLLVEADDDWPAADASSMRASRYWTSRRTAAQAAGALGVIMIPNASMAGDDVLARFASVTSRRRQPQVWLGAKAPNFGKNPDTPLLVLSVQAGARLLEFAADRPQDADSNWRPQFGAELGFEFNEHRVRAGAEPHTLTAENVIGIWPGSDPELVNEVLLVSAHYDHVGRSGDEVYNGADDNGTGSTGMLAVAEALNRYGPLRRSVALIWVSGEEKGLLGSKAWAANPTLPEGMRVIANINMDMIGRNAPEQILYTPTPEKPDIYNGLAALLEKNAPLEGFTDLGSADAYYTRSDQKSFQDAFDIPVMFLFSDIHEDYHKTTDTPDKIDTDKVARVSRTIFRTLVDLQADVLEL